MPDPLPFFVDIGMDRDTAFVQIEFGSASDKRLYRMSVEEARALGAQLTESAQTAELYAFLYDHLARVVGMPDADVVTLLGEIRRAKVRAERKARFQKPN